MAYSIEETSILTPKYTILKAQKEISLTKLMALNSHPNDFVNVYGKQRVIS